MEPSLEPSTAITIPGSISGPQVIDDLLNRVADRLEKCGDLRPVDCYRSYSAQVEIRLQLEDVGTIEVTSAVTVGVLDPQQPVRTITLRQAAAGEVDDSQPLEKPVDPAGFTEAPAQKRTYVSRIRGNRPVS